MIFRLRLLSPLLILATMLSAPFAPAQSTDRLVQVLVSKGVLSAEEAHSIAVAPAGEQSDRLAKLLVEKKVLSPEEYSAVTGSALQPTCASLPATAPASPAVPETAVASLRSTSLPAPPSTVPAIAPLRVLQMEPAKKGALLPALKLGAVTVAPYGLIKASVIYDSSSPLGTDMPLPGFMGDTGPGRAPEFHAKARFLRMGTRFEWPDARPNLTLTGRFEYDFEGDYTRVLNRNISSLRSSQASLRLAWVRLDRRLTPDTHLFALFGQDWTPFGSSTLPHLFETTGLGLGFGTLYERAPQFRFGAGHNFGGARRFFLQPEVAIVMPSYGDTPTEVANQLGFGERQGADSARPEIQSRLVMQWQLDRAPGVAPAQIVISGAQGSRKAIVPRANVPATFAAVFPHGAEVTSNRWGYTAEVQLPTRFVTVVAKYWRGADLRWYFVGNLLSAYSDVAGLTGVTYAGTVDGPSGSAAGLCSNCNMQCVAFGYGPHGPAVAPQRPVRAQGGFVNVGFPLSRWFRAKPDGQNAGWQLYLHYAFDNAFARDVRVLGNKVNKNDVAALTLYYQLNSWAAFSLEQSYYRSRTVSGFGPLFQGRPARQWQDIRSEFGPVFSF